MNSPIRVLTASLLLGVLAGLAAVPPEVALAAIALALAAAALLARRDPRRARLALLAAAAAVAGLLRAHADEHGAHPVDAAPLASVTAVVVRGGDLAVRPDAGRSSDAESTFRVEVAGAAVRLDVHVPVAPDEAP